MKGWSRNRYYYVIFIQTIMVLAEMPLCPCQQITVSDSSVDVQSLCPGDVITLTCETQGSPLIAWRSIDYVSPAIGNQLEFDDLDAIGTTQPSLVYDTTVAELTSVSRTPGTNMLVLVSQLRITIRSDVNPSSVTCVHDNGNAETITLRLLGTPGMIDIISDQRRNATGGCTVHYSWSPPSNVSINNIKHFEVTFNGSSDIVNKTEENVYMRQHSVCTCAAHDISIFAVNRCGRNGSSSNHVVSKEPVSQLDAKCDGIDAMPIDSIPAPTCGNRDVNIVGAIFGVYAIISLIVILILIVVIILCPREGKCPKKPPVSNEHEMSKVAPDDDEVKY